MTPEETLDYLYRRFPMFQTVGKAGYKPGLEAIFALDSHYGFPSSQFRCIHVAGTNGKGSVSHMLASILQEAGFKTGLFTSPHLKDFRERIRINGQMISNQEVVSFVELGRTFFEALQPSFFEVTTAMAFHHFAQHGVDVAVIETGLGGRLDSTNIVCPELTLVTNIGWDHMAYLGDTLPKIAFEKAGIMKAGVPMVLGEPDPEVLEVFVARAVALHSELIAATAHFSLLSDHITEEGTRQFCIAPAGNKEAPFVLEVDLAGECQKKNIITLCAALDALRKQPLFAKIFASELTQTAKASASELTQTSGEAPSYFGPVVARGLRHAALRTGLMGRWQLLGKEPLIVADTAHNRDGLQLSLAQAAATPHRRLRFVIGFMADKEIEAILPLFPVEADYYFTKAPLPRSLNPETLRELALTHQLRGKVFDTVQQALEQAKADAHADDLIYVGGSTFVVAEALP